MLFDEHTLAEIRHLPIAADDEIRLSGPVCAKEQAARVNAFQHPTATANREAGSKEELGLAGTRPRSRQVVQQEEVKPRLPDGITVKFFGISVER